jgi:hypothetical protein
VSRRTLKKFLKLIHRITTKSRHQRANVEKEKYRKYMDYLAAHVEKYSEAVKYQRVNLNSNTYRNCILITKSSSSR